MSDSRKKEDLAAEAAEVTQDDAATAEQENAPEVETEEVDTEEVEAEPELSNEEVLRQERDNFQEKWLRAVAEMENIRKRTRREVIETRRLAQVDILRSFLEVLDNFDRAIAAFPDSGEDTAEGNNSLREGFDLIYQKLAGTLTDRGVKPIEAMGVEFDPKVHEAVGQLPREGVEPGFVIEIVQKGFTFQDMVLRPTRVIISS